MQFTIATLTTLFAAALCAPTEATARSAISARQSSFTEFASYSESGCAAGKRIGTQVLTTTTECQNFSGGIAAGKVDIDILAGCSIQFFVGQGCSSANFIFVPKDQKAHNCFEFGQGKLIGSAKVTGTCSL